MIGRLSGAVAYKQPPFLMVDVNGVGYELESPMSTFYDLPAVGEKVTLFTHLAIRDDAHVLYGFSSESERVLFRALLKVSGVGAKVALAILSGMNADEFSVCIQNNDIASLTRLPGIGKKTAERLVVEMRDRLVKLELSGGGAVRSSATSSTLVVDNPVSDAVGALVALGYKPNDAVGMVRRADSEGLTSEEIIRQALKAMVAK
ncbi:MAG: Holliday junction branch migration protein RuvA [Sedimenticola sp.]